MKKNIFADIWQRRKMYARSMWIPILAGMAAIIFMDCGLIALQKHQYQEKIDILAVMLQGQQEGRDSLYTAVELLKGVEKSNGEAGRQQLKSYGYLEDQDNWFQLELRESIRNIILVSFVIFFIYLLCYLKILKKAGNNVENQVC